MLPGGGAGQLKESVEPVVGRKTLAVELDDLAYDLDFGTVVGVNDHARDVAQAVVDRQRTALKAGVHAGAAVAACELDRGVRDSTDDARQNCCEARQIQAVALDCTILSELLLDVLREGLLSRGCCFLGLLRFSALGSLLHELGCHLTHQALQPEQIDAQVGCRSLGRLGGPDTFPVDLEMYRRHPLAIGFGLFAEHTVYAYPAQACHTRPFSRPLIALTLSAISTRTLISWIFIYEARGDSRYFSSCHRAPIKSSTRMRHKL